VFLKEAVVSQTLFIQARELIKEKRYDEARALLREIDHPAAREWLAKLDKLAPLSASESSLAEPETPPQTPALAPSLREQLLAAREHLAAKRYDEARALLREIDHPTAREWLAKVDKLDPASVTPAPAPSHDDIMREAQRLLLQGEYDRVREMLKPLTTRVAAFWLDKTAVNQFRSHENLWLDMFRYDLPPGTPATWECPVCLRGLDQAPVCPQRGESACPMKPVSREIEEPRRLALILEALQHDQAKSIEKLAGSTGVARLENWRDALVWQVSHLLEPDIRRPAIEAAIELLGQLIDQRRT
jgi:hypothetical protein